MIDRSEKFLKDVELLKKKRVIVLDKEIIEATGVSAGNLSSYLNGKIAPSRNFLDKFYSYYNGKLSSDSVNEDTPAYETRESYTPKSNAERINTPGGTILHVPIVAEAGFVGGETDPVTNDELQQWSMPGFDEDGYSFLVKGESMFPTLKEGEVVITSRKNERFDEIRKKFIYVIVTANNILIKRVEPSKTGGKLILISDNPEYKTIEVNYDEVKIYKVRRSLIWDLGKKYK